MGNWIADADMPERLSPTERAKSANARRTKIAAAQAWLAFLLEGVDDNLRERPAAFVYAYDVLSAFKTRDELIAEVQETIGHEEFVVGLYEAFDAGRSA